MIRFILTHLSILFLLLSTGCVCNNLTQPTGEIVDAEIHVVNPPDGRIVAVQFFLETFKFQKKNNFAETPIPGAKPVLQFINSELSVLTMTLYFDSRDAGIDVRGLTENVLSLMDVDQTLHAPPILIFKWKAVEFECVLESAAQKFLSSFPDGRPSRAKMDISLKEKYILGGN